MADMNQCNFIGRLGRDPEIRHLPSGGAVANFSIAVGKKWRDKTSGEQKEHTEWVPVVCYGKTAEIVGQYARKGGRLRVTGEFQTRKWQDKQTGADRYTTEINAGEVQLLDGHGQGDGGQGRDANNGGQQQRQQAPAQRQAPQQGGGNGQFDDDIPF